MALSLVMLVPGMTSCGTLEWCEGRLAENLAQDFHARTHGEAVCLCSQSTAANDRHGEGISASQANGAAAFRARSWQMVPAKA